MPKSVGARQPAALRGMRLAIIGTGKMGQAILKGLLASGVPAAQIMGVEASAEIRAAVARQFKIKVGADPAPALAKATVVLLAVKPQQMSEAVQQLHPLLNTRHLVISIAAGITLQWLKVRLGERALVRAMPNLPATVGVGFTAVTSTGSLTARQRALALGLFGVVGETVELPEDLFDAITAVSGSGPAYVFFLVRAWEAAARSLGLSDTVARRAVRATLKGSVELLLQDPSPADVLISRVASKGGTTEAALTVLEREAVERRFIEALRAAAIRSKQLAN